MPKKRKKGRYIRGTHASPKAGECKYRSSWEHKYMLHLDSDPTVVAWSYEKIVIEYVSNIRSKKIRRYHPDFYVLYSDGREEIIEVKPKRKLEQLVVRKKAAAAIEWCKSRCMTYKILTETDLKSMGLI